MNKFCSDCNKDVLTEVDYYMVHNHLWKKYGNGKGFLCIHCLEMRMNRRLTSKDFIDCLLNRSAGRI